MKLDIDDRFTAELAADPEPRNHIRQVHEAAFSFVTPRVPTAPRLVHVSPDVAELLGIDVASTRGGEFLRVFSGARVPASARPYAMCYGGHQFGNWAGQLGDGRAINLCEVRADGGHFTLQLKGAGETPYSRSADGLAVLRSSVREHLCSEAMHGLGVPTTRSLSLVTTGDPVIRDVMYSGDPRPEPGAVVCRVARSFIRFGSFEIFASRGDTVRLRELVEFTISHHYPSVDRPGEAPPPASAGDGQVAESLSGAESLSAESLSGEDLLGGADLREDDTSDTARYVRFFAAVARRTLTMVLHWQRVGFVHGVMNTDNFSILGETIDYGPYGWLEGYDEDWTPNTTDAQHGRYRFGNQPQIALWNLVQLANALVPLVESAAPLQSVIESAVRRFPADYTAMMKSKLGLYDHDAGDSRLIGQLTETLQLTETDMTIFFRRLAGVPGRSAAKTGEQQVRAVWEAFYRPEEVAGEVLGRWTDWFESYTDRRDRQATPDGRALADERRIGRMNAVNPKYVLRNFMAQRAIDAAAGGDAGLVDELYRLLQNPYAEQEASETWFAKRPEWARNKIGCSMLSCSS